MNRSGRRGQGHRGQGRRRQGPREPSKSETSSVSGRQNAGCQEKEGDSGGDPFGVEVLTRFKEKIGFINAQAGRMEESMEEVKSLCVDFRAHLINGFKKGFKLPKWEDPGSFLVMDIVQMLKVYLLLPSDSKSSLSSNDAWRSSQRNAKDLMTTSARTHEGIDSSMKELSLTLGLLMTRTEEIEKNAGRSKESSFTCGMFSIGEDVAKKVSQSDECDLGQHVFHEVFVVRDSDGLDRLSILTFFESESDESRISIKVLPNYEHVLRLLTYGMRMNPHYFLKEILAPDGRMEMATMPERSTLILDITSFAISLLRSTLNAQIVSPELKVKKSSFMAAASELLCACVCIMRCKTRSEGEDEKMIRQVVDFVRETLEGDLESGNIPSVPLKPYLALSEMGIMVYPQFLNVHARLFRMWEKKLSVRLREDFPRLFPVPPTNTDGEDDAVDIIVRLMMQTVPYIVDRSSPRELVTYLCAHPLFLDGVTLFYWLVTNDLNNIKESRRVQNLNFLLQLAVAFSSRVQYTPEILEWKGYQLESFTPLKLQTVSSQGTVFDTLFRTLGEVIKALNVWCERHVTPEAGYLMELNMKEIVENLLCTGRELATAPINPGLSSILTMYLQVLGEVGTGIVNALIIQKGQQETYSILLKFSILIAHFIRDEIHAAPNKWTKKQSETSVRWTMAQGSRVDYYTADVSGQAMRTYGKLFTIPHFVKSSELLSKFFDCSNLHQNMKGCSQLVRINCAWAFGELLQTFCRLWDSEGYVPPDLVVERLVEMDLVIIRNVQKSRYSGYRAAGHLFKLIHPEGHTTNAMWNSALKLLSSVMDDSKKDTDYKNRWNAAFGLGCVFENEEFTSWILRNRTSVLDDMFILLSEWARKSQNYKVRLQSLVSLQRIGRRNVLGNSYSMVLKDICEVVTAYPSEENSELQERLNKTTALTLCHILRLMEPEDVEVVYESLHSHLDTLRRVTRNLDPVTLEEGDIVVAAADRIQACLNRRGESLKDASWTETNSYLGQLRRILLDMRAPSSDEGLESSFYGDLVLEDTRV